MYSNLYRITYHMVLIINYYLHVCHEFIYVTYPSLKVQHLEQYLIHSRYSAAKGKLLNAVEKQCFVKHIHIL